MIQVVILNQFKQFKQGKQKLLTFFSPEETEKRKRRKISEKGEKKQRKKNERVLKIIFLQGEKMSISIQEKFAEKLLSDFKNIFTFHVFFIILYL